jgi:hypothetical protein
MKKKTDAKPSRVSAKQRTGTKPSPVSTKKKTDVDPFAAKRRHLRFRPDPLEYAEIAVRNLGAPFTPEMVALVSEEAPMGGCGLVLLETPLLTVGDICRVKVGRIEPLRAQVMWRKAVEPGIIRLGMKFLE